MHNWASIISLAEELSVSIDWPFFDIVKIIEIIIVGATDMKNKENWFIYVCPPDGNLRQEFTASSDKP